MDLRALGWTKEEQERRQEHMVETLANMSDAFFIYRAIEDERKKGRVRVIAYDLNAPNRELLRGGDLSFVLDQVALEQGRQPLQILYNYLLNGKAPEKELLYTDILIRTKYNSGDEI